jgi:hypothetical protein
LAATNLWTIDATNTATGCARRCANSNTGGDCAVRIRRAAVVRATIVSGPISSAAIGRGAIAIGRAATPEAVTP